MRCVISFTLHGFIYLVFSLQYNFTRVRKSFTEFLTKPGVLPALVECGRTSFVLSISPLPGEQPDSYFPVLDDSSQTRPCHSVDALICMDRSSPLPH